jgi:hypothetical protein
MADKADVIDQVWRRLPLNLQSIPDIQADIESDLTQAIDAVAEEALESDKAELLQKTSGNLAISSGSASLSSLTDLKINGIIRVVLADGSILQNANNWAYLRSPKNLNYQWYHVEANTLYAMKANGTDNIANTNCTVVYQFRPTILTIPTDLVPALIEKLVSMRMAAA